VTKKERGLVLGLDLRELIDTWVLIGGAYIMPPASAPDLLGAISPTTGRQDDPVYQRPVRRQGDMYERAHACGGC